MARTSNKARDLKRRGMIARYANKRAELKAAGDQAGLDRMPRNSSRTRLKHRCFRCARPRAYMRDFALCSRCFRELANAGKIPGVKKASW